MKLDVKSLVDSVSVINKITATDLIGLKLKNKKLTVTGTNSGRSMSVTSKVAEAGSWDIAISKEALDKTLKGRKELDLELEKNGHLKLSAKSFEASLATQPSLEDATLQAEGAIAITSEQQHIIDYGLSVASLPPIYEGDTIFCVDINKKGSTIACFDQLHFALVESSGTKGALNFAFPTKTFEVVAAAARKTSYSMSTTSAAICAWNEDWALVLPFVQTEVAQSIADVKKLASAFGPCFVRCGTSSLVSALEAALAVIETGGSVSLVAREGQLQISSESSIGKVTEKVPAKLISKKPINVRIDPSVCLSLLYNVPSEYIELGIHNDNFFFIKVEDEEFQIVYGCLLSETPST